MAKERIGIMGGSFDPLHQGHIRMAQHALEAHALDRVLMLTTGTPPYKPDITPAEDRYRMVCAACTGIPGLEPSREEIDRPGPIYTVDTLSILHEKYPKAELYYILGADALMRLKNWHRYERVLTQCTLLVCPRSSLHTQEALDKEIRRLCGMGGHIAIMDMDLIDVSSSELRTALQTGADMPLLPVQVREYSRAAGLYGVAGLPQGAQWLTQLFRDLSVKRFSHTLAVADTARALALRHHLDADRAEIAGLLHDCAKCLPLKEMQRIAKDNHLTEDEDVLNNPALLHSLAGACRARMDYGVEDPKVLGAIRSHTTGRPGMSRLDMVVWLADTIEPTRAPYPLLEEVRALAQVSLERAMIASLEGTLSHVRRKGFHVHPATIHTLEWLRTLPC